ncbi:hypothetical protein [Peptoniphilus asaccharolyticus]
MENNLKITQIEEGIKIVETKQYTMSINDIKNELNSIAWRKDDLVRQSQRIKKDYDDLSSREKELKVALEKLENRSEVEVLE